MTRYGYFFSSEENSPQELVRQATSSLLASGRFTLGVGSGEALNEHILGTAWPSAEERLVGSEHAGFFEFYAGQVLPRLREA